MLLTKVIWISMKNKINIYILSINLLLLIGCTYFKYIRFNGLSENKVGNTLDNVIYYSSKFNIDTLKGIFFLENLTYASIDGDVVQQAPIFLFSDSISYDAYKSGIFYLRLDTVINKKQISFDTSSLNKFYIDVNFGADTTMLSYARKTNYNPFCGAFYTKYWMNAIVVNLGTCVRGIPRFINCDSLLNHYKEKEKQLYRLDTLPCYQFIKIIDFKCLTQ